ncbi:MAG: recombination protein RecR [Planctomycetes bacterium]|nr:recombination protein RecR [Planctomycetota bacterium]MCB9871650.1 recombination protein RecR [Planctomycetota bacterium]
MPGPRSVEHLKQCFARLPGIGPKTAERLSYFLLRADQALAFELADAIRTARASTLVCSVCFNLDEVDPCSICADPRRDHAMVLVVEDPRDVAAFDATGYRGLYHVLQGRVSAIEGIAPEDLTAAQLFARARSGTVREVCLATNPDLEGEATARMLAERLAEQPGLVVSRLARGIPAGSNITQVSQSILADAVEGRRVLRGDA